MHIKCFAKSVLGLYVLLAGRVSSCKTCNFAGTHQNRDIQTYSVYHSTCPSTENEGFQTKHPKMIGEHTVGNDRVR